MSAKDEKKAVDLGLLDEDDEFEEFPAEGNCRLAFNQNIYCQWRSSWPFNSKKFMEIISQFHFLL